MREVSPTVDASSGTVRVKIGLASTPPAMGLGAVVVGHGRFAPHEAVELPWSALYRYDGRPSVWIYDPAHRTVALRAVEIDRFGPDIIALRTGVEPGERVVIAGIQFLRPAGRRGVRIGGSPMIARAVLTVGSSPGCWAGATGMVMRRATLRPSPCVGADPGR